MMSLLNLGIAFSYVTLSSLAAVILKKAEKKDILVLWTLLFMYFSAHIAFFIMKVHDGLTFHQTTLFILNLYRENILFYIIRGISIVLGNILLFYLMNHFPVTQIILVLQLSVPISAFCFYFLGNPLTWNVILGTIIVTLGALISGLPKFYFPNIFKPLLEIPPKIYILGTLKSLITVFGSLLLFIVSTRTSETNALFHFLKHTPLFDLTDLSFYTAFDYAIGMAPWILTTYFLYFIIIKKITSYDMKKYMENHSSLVFLNGAVISFSYITYAYAFGHVEDKFLMSIIGKCQIPLTLIFAAYLLNEKVTLPQKIATVLILLGSTISIL